MKQYTAEEWYAEGTRRFGKNIENWKFICPHCGNIASGIEFKNAGATPNDMYRCCIGRFNPLKGCDWHANGLLNICDVKVDDTYVFDFAPGEDEEE